MPGDGVALQEKAGYGQLPPTHGGAEDTEERVYGMVSLMTFSRDNKLWRPMLSCSLGQSKAGFLVKSMRLIPMNMVAQACDRVRLRRLPREACCDQAEKDTGDTQ